MCKSRNGDWFSTLRNKTSTQIIYTIIILEKLAEIYGICKWLIEHCKKNIRDLVVFYQNWTYYGRIVFVVVGCLFYYIYLYDSRLYGIIQNIYAMLSNELCTCFYFHLYRVFFACLFRLIVDMILNLNGKFSARVQILWQKQTVSTRILNDLIV